MKKKQQLRRINWSSKSKQRFPKMFSYCLVQMYNCRKWEKCQLKQTKEGLSLFLFGRYFCMTREIVDSELTWITGVHAEKLGRSNSKVCLSVCRASLCLVQLCSFTLTMELTQSPLSVCQTEIVNCH